MWEVTLQNCYNSLYKKKHFTVALTAMQPTQADIHRESELKCASLVPAARRPHGQPGTEGGMSIVTSGLLPPATRYPGAPAQARPASCRGLGCSPEADVPQLVGLWQDHLMVCLIVHWGGEFE